MGRPEKDVWCTLTEYGEEADNARHPTAAHTWEKVNVFTGKASALYKAFTNELDNLTSYQVYEQASFYVATFPVAYQSFYRLTGGRTTIELGGSS